MKTAIYKLMFPSKRVFELTVASIIGELAVAVTVWTICPPSESAWTTYFAFRRSILPSMVAIGISIGILHGIRNDIKRPVEWLGTLMLDTIGLLIATHLALKIAMQASLSLAFTEPFNTPLSFLGEIKPFQVVDVACIAALIPALLLLLAWATEKVESLVQRLATRKSSDKVGGTIPLSPIVVCGISHRFTKAGSASRLSKQVKEAIPSVVKASLGGAARSKIRWQGDTVEVEVSIPRTQNDTASSSERTEGLSLKLAAELASLDAADDWGRNDCIMV